VLRRLLVIGVLLLAPAEAANAQLREQQLLMPGVSYVREAEFTLHGPVVLNVITASKPTGSLVKLEPLLSNDAVVASDRLTVMEQALAGEGTVAAVNGDYFNPNPGNPKGILIRNGVLDSPPDPDRSSAGIGADGTLQIARVAFAGIWKGTGQRRPLTINQPPSSGPVTLYTAAWGPTTPSESGVVEVVIPSLPPTRPNADVSGTVGQTLGAGNTPIPPGGGVLVARGNQAAILAREAPAGTSLFFRMALTPNWSGMVSAIGGGPALVKDGKPIFRANEDIGGSLLNPRGSRTAVGQLADGRLLLVTVDGGIAGYSVGMTNFELALAMKRFGAVQAMALGSGPSAAMAFDGTLLSRPRGAVEAPISNALGIVYTGVYAAPPSSEVISPNGDGVDDSLTLTYRVIRPSTVTAAVVGGGTRQILETGSVQPGPHTFTFAGTTAAAVSLPEGQYRFSVTATDDRGQTSTADRLFVLDNTLASLAVNPPVARLSARSLTALTATFVLSRAAAVRATVETRSGIVIKALAAGQLAPGTQQVAWDGRTASGSLAFGGAYVVHVQATSSIGEVDLSQSFIARRG
jgi:flagellar hook assembly protein FlgD